MLDGSINGRYVLNLERAMARTAYTRSSEISGLTSPEQAPRTIRFSGPTTALFEHLRTLSFPKGHSKEQGATIVADKEGELSLQNIGEMGSDDHSFHSNLVIQDARRFELVGVFHTHPYDKEKGSYRGVSFSGADLENLVDNRLTISVVQSGPRLFALVRTDRSPKRIVPSWSLDDAVRETTRARVKRGAAFPQATRVEAATVAATNGLAYYQGALGTLTRVSPP